MADELLSVLPVHYSTRLGDSVQLLQFPLLERSLVVPPTAAEAGKRIKARRKPNAARLEIHVPLDTRPDLWNSERGQMMGAASAEEDVAAAGMVNPANGAKGKERGDERPRLSELRLSSTSVPARAAYMAGIVRDGVLHLHPISATHQLRPSLTYLDVLSRKSKRRGGGSDSDDSDEGPPPDSDNEGQAQPAKTSKSRPSKAPAAAKEVTVSVRKSDDSGRGTGGLSGVRSSMLKQLHAEEDEAWEDLSYSVPVAESSFSDPLDPLLSQSSEKLMCQTLTSQQLSGS